MIRTNNTDPILTSTITPEELSKEQKLKTTKYLESHKLNALQATNYYKISTSLHNLGKQQYQLLDTLSDIVQSLARYVLFCGDVHKIEKLLDQKDSSNDSYRSLLTYALQIFSLAQIKPDTQTQLSLALVCFYFGLSYKSTELESELKTTIKKPTPNDFTEVAGVSSAHAEIALHYVNQILTFAPNIEPNNKNATFFNYAAFLKLLCDFNISQPADQEQYEKALTASAKLLNTPYSYSMLAIFFSLDPIEKHKEASTNFAISYRMGNKAALKYYYYHYALHQQDMIDKKYPADESLSDKPPFIYFARALILGYEVAATNISIILDAGVVFTEAESLDTIYKLYQLILKNENTYKQYGLTAELVKKILITECLDKLIFGGKAILGTDKYNSLYKEYSNEDNEPFDQDELDAIVTNCFIKDFDSNKLLPAALKAGSTCISSLATNKEYIDEFYKRVHLEIHKIIWSKNAELSDSESQDDFEDKFEGFANNNSTQLVHSAAETKIAISPDLKKITIPEVKTPDESKWIEKLNSGINSGISKSYSSSDEDYLRYLADQEKENKTSPIVLNYFSTETKENIATPAPALISNKFAKYLTKRLKYNDSSDSEPPAKKARFNGL